MRINNLRVKTFSDFNKDTFDASLNNFLAAGVELIGIEFSTCKTARNDASASVIAIEYSAIVIYKDN